MKLMGRSDPIRLTIGNIGAERLPSMSRDVGIGLAGAMRLAGALSHP
jgi:hypothetical protein